MNRRETPLPMPANPTLADWIRMALIHERYTGAVIALAIIGLWLFAAITP